MTNRQTRKYNFTSEVRARLANQPPAGQQPVTSKSNAAPTEPPAKIHVGTLLEARQAVSDVPGEARGRVGSK